MSTQIFRKILMASVIGIRVFCFSLTEDKWVYNEYTCFNLTHIKSINNIKVFQQKTPIRCSALAREETNLTGFCYDQMNQACYVLPQADVVTGLKTVKTYTSDSPIDKCCIYVNVNGCSPPMTFDPSVGCIYVTTALADRETSRGFCLGIGADLWSDPSNLENMSRFLSKYVNGTSGNQFWIALKQIANHGQFLWLDGSQSIGSGPNKWIGWDGANPDGPNNVDECVRSNQAWNFLVGDTTCGNKFYAVCEKKLF